jgi:hypothetical protein
MKTGGRSCLKPGLLYPFDAVVNGIMCWFTSTFSRTLGSFENIFSTFFVPVDVLIGAAHHPIPVIWMDYRTGFGEL